jgi:hypothetical protein
MMQLSLVLRKAFPFYAELDISSQFSRIKTLSVTIVPLVGSYTHCRNIRAIRSGG